MKTKERLGAAAHGLWLGLSMCARASAIPCAVAKLLAYILGALEALMLVVLWDFRGDSMVEILRRHNRLTLEPADECRHRDQAVQTKVPDTSQTYEERIQQQLLAIERRVTAAANTSARISAAVEALAARTVDADRNAIYTAAATDKTLHEILEANAKLLLQLNRLSTASVSELSTAATCCADNPPGSMRHTKQPEYRAVGTPPTPRQTACNGGNGAEALQADASAEHIPALTALKELSPAPSEQQTYAVSRTQSVRSHRFSLRREFRGRSWLGKRPI